MLSDEETRFLTYWRDHRKRNRKVLRQFMLGIPLGLLFAGAILLNFFSGWNKQATMIANTSDFNPGVLILALLLIVGFIAIFSKRVEWEKNEERYRALEAKKEMEESQGKPSEPAGESDGHQTAV